MKCWGLNTNGQLGNGTTTSSKTPVAVSGISLAIKSMTGSNSFSLSMGGAHSCVLVANSGVQCWGANNFGQLGNGTNVQTTTPNSTNGFARSHTISVIPSYSGTYLVAAVTASNSTGIVTTWLPSTNVVNSAPYFRTSPKISGSTSIGSTLTLESGDIVGEPIPSVSQQWYKCEFPILSGTDPIGSSCSAIENQTSNKYEIGASDVGQYLATKIIAVSSAGSISYWSGTSLPVSGSNAQNLFQCKFGMNQVFDVQWRIFGNQLGVSSLARPYTQSGRTMPEVSYLQFVPVGSNGDIGLEMFDVNGNSIGFAFRSGSFKAIGEDFVFYLGGGGYGTIFLTNRTATYGDQLNLTTSQLDPLPEQVSTFNSCQVNPMS